MRQEIKNALLRINASPLAIKIDSNRKYLKTLKKALLVSEAYAEKQASEITTFEVEVIRYSEVFPEVLSSTK